MLAAGCVRRTSWATHRSTEEFVSRSTRRAELRCFGLVCWGNGAMRDNDGRKLDHRTLEALRLRVVDQVANGAHPEDVAAALGMHRKRC